MNCAKRTTLMLLVRLPSDQRTKARRSGRSRLTSSTALPVSSGRGRFCCTPTVCPPQGDWSSRLSSGAIISRGPRIASRPRIARIQELPAFKKFGESETRIKMKAPRREPRCLHDFSTVYAAYFFAGGAIAIGFIGPRSLSDLTRSKIALWKSFVGAGAQPSTQAWR